MSVSGPSPLGTLMVQRVEAALGVTLAQQANVASGARPDAVTQPGQPDKVDPAKNPPPKEQEGRRAADPSGRQGSLAAVARNDPEIAKLLAARNAPMTAYTASAPTSLGQAAKTILALLQQFPDSKPIGSRAPLLTQSPAQGGAQASGQNAATSGLSGQGAPSQAATNLDPRAIQALMARAGGEGGTDGAAANAAGTRPTAGASPLPQTTSGLPAQATNGAPAGTPAGGPLGGGYPLPSGIAGQLAMALSQAIQSSGLFYEAHLRDFAFGQRTLAQMRAEPQAQAGQGAGRGTTADVAHSTRSGAEAATGTAASSSQSTAQAATQGANPAAHNLASTGAHLAGALLGLDPSTHALVRQQLETLANQSFAWQGEAWPGAELDWQVRRRESGGDDPEQPESWATSLKLNLHGLGEVQARLSISGSQIVMHLAAPDGASVMSDHTELLRHRLIAQGLQLSQITISRDDDHTDGDLT